MVLFPMTLSDLEGLSEILSDAKQRAVSLRQLSFLLVRLSYCIHLCHVQKVLQIVVNLSSGGQFFFRDTVYIMRVSRSAWCILQ